MRPEKEFLVKEVTTYLEDGEYLFLADYTGITVEETAELRDALVKEDATFHVIKNSAFNVAAKRAELPDFTAEMNGPTAIVSGGNNPSGVAKALIAFYNKKEKVVIKAGMMDKKYLSVEEVETLSKLPSLEALRGQLLGLLNTPAQQMVRVLNAVPQDMLNVLAAKQREDETAA